MRPTNLGRALFASILLGSISSAPAQPVELEIRSRRDWGARSEITRRTDAQALELLKRQKKLKAGDDPAKVHRNVEEEMPRRLPPVYITIHHSEHSLPGGSLKQKLLGWQKSMQEGYDLERRDKGGTSYLLHAFPGDIPYHFLVSEDGSVGVGRDLKFGVFSNTTYLDRPRKEMTPAELRALDMEVQEDKDDPPTTLALWRNKAMARHITVVLEGNFDKKKLEGNQRQALVNLLVKLAKEHRISPTRFTFHKDVAKEYTSCPGENVIKAMDDLKKEVSARIK